jgi:hypothetical protein
MSLRSFSLANILLLLSSGAAFTQEQSRYWIITGIPDGKFFYRNKTNERIPLSGNFTPLFESSEVWCEAKPCELTYASPHSEEPQKLQISLVPKRWIPLSTARPKPEPPVLPLAKELSAMGRRAGREKGGLCSGSVAIRAPACDELIDVDNFSVEWTPTPGAKGRVEIRLTQMDLAGNSGEEFPPIVTNFEGGQYSSSSLRDYLAKIQRSDGRIRLRIDLRRSVTERATRTILLPSIQELEAFRKKMREMDIPNMMLRSLARMWAALQEERWTMAAKEAIRLQAEDKKSLELQAYAMVGLCRSGYDDNREALRATMAAAGYNDICATMASSSTGVAATPSTTQPGKAKRIGIALLIGNSDYPEDQLDAVRHDIEGMSSVLVDLGFEVVEAPNLDTTQEFHQTIANFLQSKSASADDIALVYYSGHGMQFKDKTYLLGKNYAQLGQSTLAALSNAYRLDEILEQIQGAAVFARIVIFDACRNNILAKENAQEGDVSFGRKSNNTFVMLANKPGHTVAARAVGEFRSPFTEGLIHGFSKSKGGLLEIFTVARDKTKELSPGQEPELLTSDPDRLDSTILLDSSNKAKTNRGQEMLEKACPFYGSRSWDTYLPMMKVASALSEDVAVRSHLNIEISFAELIQKAEAEASRKNYDQAAKLWKQAAAMFPGRNWVRLQAALAALAIDDVRGALAELATMPAGPDATIPARANLLLVELVRSFPAEAELTRAAAAKPQQVDELECVVKQ